MGVINFIVTAFYIITFSLFVIDAIYMGIEMKSVILNTEENKDCLVFLLFNSALFAAVCIFALCYFLALKTWLSRRFSMTVYCKIMAGIFLIHVMIFFVWLFASHVYIKYMYIYRNYSCHYKTNSKNAVRYALWLSTFHGLIFGAINLCLLVVAAENEEDKRLHHDTPFDSTNEVA